jgi:hypothetical protein
MTDELNAVFAMSSEVKMLKPPKVFGEVGPNKRYHMPLLPGEQGTKSGGDWIPGGITRMTNLVGAFEDTRALNVWEQAMALIGVALSPSLSYELEEIVRQALRDEVVFERLREYPTLRQALAGLPGDSGESIVGRAKELAGAHNAARRGTEQHAVWEGSEPGTERQQELVEITERLLRDAGLRRVAGLRERTVRNVVLRAAGKFDDILEEVSTGRLLIADLKTKEREFYSFMAVDAQLAGYAYAEWMIRADRTGYEPGPWRLGVDLTEGVIMHTPAIGDGAPRLERVDLVEGWEVAQLARQVVDKRAHGKSVERKSRSTWCPAKPAEHSS